MGYFKCKPKNNPFLIFLLLMSFHIYVHYQDTFCSFSSCKCRMQCHQSNAANASTIASSVSLSSVVIVIGNTMPTELDGLNNCVSQPYRQKLVLLDFALNKSTTGLQKGKKIQLHWFAYSLQICLWGHNMIWMTFNSTYHGEEARNPWLKSRIYEIANNGTRLAFLQRSCLG